MAANFEMAPMRAYPEGQMKFWIVLIWMYYSHIYI